MKAGSLRHRVTLQSRPSTKDSFGQEASDFADVATVWARVSPLVGREFFTARQIAAEVTHKVVLRYHSGLVPKMRLKFGTRFFDVQSVLNIDERNRELELLCIEVL